MKRNHQSVVLISGAPGVGKNHLANLLFTEKTVDIDSFGAWHKKPDQPDEWLVDMSKVPKNQHVYVGNFGNVGVTAPILRQLKVTVILVPWPPYDRWKETMVNRKKTSEHPEKYGVRANFTKAEFEAFLRKYLTHIKDAAGSIPVNVVYTALDKYGNGPKERG